MLALGLLGNSIGFIVFSHKRMATHLGRNMYRSLAVVNSAYLVYIVLINLFERIKLDVKLNSKLECKILTYFEFSVGAVSAWILVYISIEKYISIRFATQVKLIRSNWIQFLIVTLILLFNLVYYVPFLVFFTLIESHNSTLTNYNNNTTLIECSSNQNILLKTMDLINSTVLPFCGMLTMSILLSYLILSIKLRFVKLADMTSSTSQLRMLQKEIKYGIVSVLMNFNFLILNFPICLIDLLSGDVTKESAWYFVSCYLFYASFSTNFYIFALFNSSFRNELLVLFRLKKDQITDSISNNNNINEPSNI